MTYHYEKSKSLCLIDFYKNYLDASINGRNSFFIFPDENIQSITNGLKGKETAENAIAIFEKLRNILISCDKYNESIKVLDYGCGWGRLTRLFSNQIADKNIYGVDVDERLIKSAQECIKALNFLLIQSMKKLPFDGNFFDVIFANSVFSHLSEKSALFALSELSRITSLNKGVMIISVLEKTEMDKFYRNEKQKKWIETILGNEEIANAKLVKDGFVWGSTKRWDNYGIAIMTNDWLTSALQGNGMHIRGSFKTNQSGSHCYKIIEKI